jgi:hypothetical protein
MNPGTTLFIIIGIIGLLLYTLKALKPVQKEFFTSPTQPTEDMLTNYKNILSAIDTPDFDDEPSTFKMPSLLPLSNNNLKTSENLTSTSNITSITSKNIVPSASDVVKEHAPILDIPVKVAPIQKKEPTSDMKNSAPQTISDKQGYEMNKIKDEIIQTKPTINMIKKKKVVQSNSSNKKNKTSKKCPPMPDMSLYIRKDQIPCWGCVIP